MKRFLQIFFVVFALGFTTTAFAQTETKVKTKHRTQESGTVAENDPTRPQRFQTTPAPGGFSVVKYRESKVKKKLRKGEAQSRFSVPNPKGKPLKHKKKHKFLFFGQD